MSNVKAVPISELLGELYKELPEYKLMADMLQARISTEITSARIERNMNQQEFAAFMGVTQSQVSKWENGGFNFTVEKICEIACKLDMACTVILSPRRKSTDFEGTNITLFSDYVSTASRYQAESIDLMEG